MTEFRFYEYRVKSLEEVLPEILSKAHERGMRAVVLLDNADEVRQLNAALWTYNPNSFLPHGSAEDGDGAHQPIWLTDKAGDKPNNAKLLVLTDLKQIDEASQYDICCVMVDGQNQNLAIKAKTYFDQNKLNSSSLAYWIQSPAGKWEKSV